MELNRDRQPLEKKGDVSFILDLCGDIRPSSPRKSMAESLIGPSVSTAIGWKENEAGRSAYFTSFLEAAASAAAACCCNRGSWEVGICQSGTNCDIPSHGST